MSTVQGATNADSRQVMKSGPAVLGWAGGLWEMCDSSIGSLLRTALLALEDVMQEVLVTVFATLAHLLLS